MVRPRTADCYCGNVKYFYQRQIFVQNKVRIVFSQTNHITYTIWIFTSVKSLFSTNIHTSVEQFNIEGTK
jgi:hypothetical protein